jgi:hypothetical protein
MWIALKVVLLPCSTSAYEHIWSIEGWIHSNRRNRLGQKLVDRLVRTHTNLNLEQRLEMYEAGLLPWDIEMTVEEAVSDDDDGPPHRVSDSESFVLLVHIRGSQTCCNQNTTTVTDTQHPFH